MGEGASKTRCGRVRPVVIVGPTASGKTAAALELAERVGGEIISADSMAIYRGMNIGTAKPTPEERERVPFHMVDVVDPNELFTVADFQEQAVRIIDDLMARCILPLLVGGTGLYVKAVIDGLNIPRAEPNPDIRAKYERLAEERGPDYLHSELARVDPETARRLHLNDLKRIIRALEVYEQAGTPMSEIIAETKLAGPRYPDAMFFGLTMERETLYRRIEERVDWQIREGLVEEVAELLDRGVSPDAPAMQGLGYKEIVVYLKGQCDLAAAIDLLKRDTRRFAKRQYTWFRVDARIDWIEVDDLSPSQAADIMEAKLRGAGIVGQDVG